MVPVKLECNCGQHYAFDVEPFNGKMPSNVACPGCGVDGTGMANQFIAQTLADSPVIIPPAPAAGLRLFASEPAAPAAAPPKSALHASQFGLVDRNQAEIEARAKVSWGDSPEAVIKYLMIQGFTHTEASDLVGEMFKVRAAETRANGIKKILTGFGMMCVPVIALSMHLQMISLKLMGGAIGVGLWGIFVLVQGAIMVIAPKMETGDVAEQ